MADLAPEFAEALFNAQQSLKIAKKDSKNPHFKSTYADLQSVWEAASDALAANGIAVVQSPGPLHEDGKVVGILMTTHLIHRTGHILSTACALPARAGNPQDYGSAIKYARRYGLASALMIVDGVDDDGNAAVKADKEVKSAEAKPVDEKLSDAITKLQAVLPKDDGEWERYIANLKTKGDCRAAKPLLVRYLQGNESHQLYQKMAERFKKAAD